MKTTVLVLILSTSSFAFANPNILCEPNYAKKEASGATAEMKTGAPISVSGETATATLKGFEVQTRLDQICDSNGNHCAEANNLNVKIKKDKSTSVMNVDLKGTDKRNRYSTSLIVGDETVYVNCDLM